ncbi:uncharacterized protein EV154DRAFT_296354 [Mucor mucedo]|uniref:uncharacterized protein n=1 Tax=Mucor mucedo TaxID=29922 RepID=UPI0022202881|nr:uncharacterized protein EV154DRAFT_296354 [Mucor mucedo]KAI7895814.1 hypothetical protein EV154DRAFT_296354 [Mucor mucedo]
MLEQQEEHEQQQPRQPNPRFDSLFDVHWDDDERPPSPIAMQQEETWYEGESSVFTDNGDKPTRSASMPPTFSSSSSSSFHFEGDEDAFHTFNLRVGEQSDYRRSASMEPFIDTSTTHYQATSPHQQQLQEPAIIHRGHPPHAPRMRHAEAPVPIRPIPEEEEDEPVIAPVVLEQEVLDGRNNNDNDGGEEEEENVEEFEGVLEAIGMNGSIWSLMQNSALMGLLIALSLGAAVWIPYLIGISFIITETLDIIRVPLKLTRLITDPLIDFLFMVCADYIWPVCMEQYEHYVQPLVASTTVFDKVATAFKTVFEYTKDHGLLFADSSHTTLSDTVSAATEGTAADTMMDHGIQYMTKFINDTEPYLEQAFTRYQQLATGQTAMDRFACIAVGYMVIISLGAWYLSRATRTMSTATFGRTAQEALRHQGLIFKVGMFVTIELVLFPIVCGFLLDLSTMPLFKQASFGGRLGYLSSHPISSVFLHWFLGTGFMFLFAVLVTICRDIVRPGVMWFIRDPNDPQFHPIREIVERPILFQFKKIGGSALIYLTVILVGVGGLVHVIHSLIPDILPLRWSLSNPLSVVPIDLIVIQVGIPAIVKYFQPKQTIKRLFIKWMTWTSRQLRLTSFIFGGRKPAEEGTLVYHSWWAWITRMQPNHYPDEGSCQDIIGPQVSYLWDGQLLRVPRHDSVPILDQRRMLVPVDTHDLQPVDELERIMGHPASSAPGGDEVNTVIVYSPPNFKRRLIVFVGFMWLTTSMAFCAMTILPVMFGRYVFEEMLGVHNEVHDIYSFVLGGTLLLLVGAFIAQCYKSMCEVMRQPTWNDFFAVLFQHAEKWTCWSLRWTWFIMSFGVVLPLVFGALIELYFVLPLRQLGQDSPTVEVMPMWSHGFACMVIFHGLIQVAPDATARNLINNVFRGGIGEMDVVASFKKLLGPLLFASGVAICLPFVVAYVNMKVVARTNPELRVKLVQVAYPTALIGIGTYYLSKMGSQLKRRLTQTIREDNYLVGRTLHNLDH